MSAKLDSISAGYIASKFFEQYHSEVVIKKIILDNGVWVVDLTIGKLSEQNRQVKIDARYGKILGYG